eukprot:3140554-Ditylum_brightwellii.AAC.1
MGTINFGVRKRIKLFVMCQERTLCTKPHQHQGFKGSTADCWAVQVLYFRLRKRNKLGKK